MLHKGGPQAMLGFSNDSPRSGPARRAARALLGLAFLPLASLPAAAAVPADAPTRAQVIGQPVALLVQPPLINLSGPRAMQQLVVTGRYADGNVRDLTPFCDITADGPGIISVGEGGFLQPLKNGAAA